MKQIHLILHGKVQNVMLREHIRKSASQYNVKGWVKNKKDGTVEVIAQGREIDLEKFIPLCKKGSFMTHVEKFDQTEELIEEEFDSFQIRHL